MAKTGLLMVSTTNSTSKPVNEGALAAERADATLEAIDSLNRELSSDQYQTELPYELPSGFLLSVVVPVFNEQQTIGQVIHWLYQLPLPIEVIAVDDGSTDGTVAELTRLNKAYPDLIVCVESVNQGKGAALRRGFELARGTHVVIQDADLEYDPTDIPRLIEPLANGDADAVYGSRFLMQHWQGSSLIHRLGNRFLTYLSNCMTGLRLTDMETCYKVFRRDLLDDISLEQNRFGFEVELTAKLAKQQARIVERPIRYAARTWEQGKKIGIRDGLQALYCIAKYR